MDERFFGVGEWLNAEEAQNYLVYGQVYGMAVKTMIEHFEKPAEKLLTEADASGRADVSLLPSHALGILPIVFNFRHYVELKLKGLILMKGEKVENTHDIYRLLKKLKEISETRQISNETEAIIKKLQESDNRSDAYRYPCDVGGEKHFQESNEFLKSVNNFEKFKNDVSIVMSDLSNIEGYFDAQSEYG